MPTQLPSREFFLAWGIQPVRITDLPEDCRDCPICVQDYTDPSSQSSTTVHPITPDGCFANTCPMCRTEVFELDEAPSSDESNGEEQGEINAPPNTPVALTPALVPGYSAATDGVRARLARDNVPILITDANYATLYYDPEWYYDLWASVDDTLYDSVSWDDVEYAWMLIMSRIVSNQNALPARLYDVLLDAALRRAALREIGPAVWFRRWIRSIVEYLRDRDFEEL
ncbi:hypothetical protein H2199_004237 [Coniosporium tulheliwenetii]|uniref:Uncharacterized protein n=1 Tax=Coniosporium tulheliwenetii TaxID=3383036 RepID=A0ACC2Z7L2_9PEZI|nr:hypothetical protein H2199_004237 [Cladosporium sp. JES 115]